MWGRLLAVALLATGVQPAQQPPADQIQSILARVSEEAEVFRANAPKMLAEETLVQRALKPPRRFRPRVGTAAVTAPKPEYRMREVVSEYGYSSFKGSPNALHEFRQVVTVDGRRVSTQEEARRSLAIGMRSEDDAVKKRMLERFEKHGLAGAAADFGQVLLLFRRRQLRNYEFRVEGEGRIGADAALILTFRQRGGEGSLLIFEKRKAMHLPLAGRLWVRSSDSRPLRVELSSIRKEGEIEIRDEATVDYTVNAHGVAAPASVVHRQFGGATMVVENVFRYSPFRVFSVDATVKFQ
jgi:hypothetical protein